MYRGKKRRREKDSLVFLIGPRAFMLGRKEGKGERSWKKGPDGHREWEREEGKEREQHDCLTPGRRALYSGQKQRISKKRKETNSPHREKGDINPEKKIRRGEDLREGGREARTF